MFENVLSTMIFLPVVAGLVLLMLPISQCAARRLGLVATIIILILGIRLAFGFSGAGGMEYSEVREILPTLGIQYSLGIDGISLFVLLTSALLFPLVFLVMTKQTKGCYGNLLIAQGTMAGAICATDLILDTRVGQGPETNTTGTGAL